MKNELLRFIEDQTRFSTSWHAEMSANPNKQGGRMSLGSNLHTTSKHATKNLPNMEGLICTQNHQLPTSKSHVGLEDNSYLIRYTFLPKPKTTADYEGGA